MTPAARPRSGPLLSPEELATNLAGMHAQLERLVDFGDAAGQSRAMLLDNGTWLNDLAVIEFLRDVGKHFSVNQMMAREAVKTRLERPEQGISYTEFSYMLLQAYDYLHLFDEEDCRLQLGASDQWGNITMGIELIRKARRAEVYGLTTPLVLKADGTKFGKTETETVWLDAAKTSPYQLYQFFYRTEDSRGGRVSPLLHVPRPRHHPETSTARPPSIPNAVPRSVRWPVRCAPSSTGPRNPGGPRRRLWRCTRGS